MTAFEMPPQPPAPPYDLELSTTMQLVATVLLWSAVAIMLAYAVRRCRAERSAFPLIIVLAVATGSLIEPLYDTAYHLHWLDAGRQWTLFTSFGLPQPVWVMPAYVVVFALPALLCSRSWSIDAPVSRMIRIAALTAATTTVFEIAAVNLDLYVYYGDSAWKVAGYPLFIGVMEAVQITTFAILTATLRRVATRPAHALALFALFPCNFAFTVLGAGFPTVILQNSSSDPSAVLLFVSGFASVSLGLIALWWSIRLLLVARTAARQVHQDASTELVA